MRALAAVSLGALIGFLMGLSRTSVAHDVIVAILAGSLAFVGLAGGGEGGLKALFKVLSPTGTEERSFSAIALMSAAMILGVIGGMYFRQIDPFGRMAIQKRYETWNAIDPGAAAKIVEAEFSARSLGEAHGSSEEGGAAENEREKEKEQEKEQNAPSLPSPMQGGLMSGDRPPNAACMAVQRLGTPPDAASLTAAMQSPELQQLLSYVAPNGQVPPERVEGVVRALRGLCGLPKTRPPATSAPSTAPGSTVH
jgi:hypothetical protein